jgi:ABC-type proline/glycine betaine transport system permease subunit
MEINATFIGQIIALLVLPILAIIVALVSYYLGKRKTETPKLVAAIGFFSAIIPPLALVYLMVLVFKKDINQID